jgi:hypothetical protein
MPGRRAKGLAALQQLIRDYVEGKIPFRIFHNSFIEQFVRVPDSSFSDRSRGAWHTVYEMVLVSVPDSPAESPIAGVLEDSELKAQLREIQRERLLEEPP